LANLEEVLAAGARRICACIRRFECGGPWLDTCREVVEGGGVKGTHIHK